MGGGSSGYLGVVVDTFFPREACAMIWELIKREASNWDVIDLTDLPATSALLRRPAPRLPWVIEVQDACPVLSFPTPAQTLSDIVPHRQLRNLRNASNRLERSGKSKVAIGSP